MQQLFIGDISLSDGIIESVMLLEGAARVEFRLWDGGRALFRFTGVIGVRDRNSAGQEVESMEIEEVALIQVVPAEPFLTELMEERRADRTAPILRYAFIGSWTMRPILEIYAEYMEAERAYGL
ncbi:hypothetical protein [Saccharibacillus kuerlensis]|uniref:Uncharacterized protein n=1 Tax=Saccharibacillus kuerlensis TaxID=459527 RepID=A0ABQ2L808_9BACL|nr:hypothetical protein [Saccharibacillus kuerlensis]GGO06380.1 hypothetical protein GCM10010969_33760 [Saccharibacillus kuerlensis]